MKTRFNLCIGTVFKVKGKSYLITGISFTGQEPNAYHFAACEMTYKSVIMGEKIYKKPANDMVGLLESGEMDVLGWRELPANFTGSAQ